VVSRIQCHGWIEGMRNERLAWVVPRIFLTSQSADMSVGCMFAKTAFSLRILGRWHSGRDMY